MVAAFGKRYLPAETVRFARHFCKMVATYWEESGKVFDAAAKHPITVDAIKRESGAARCFVVVLFAGPVSLLGPLRLACFFDTLASNYKSAKREDGEHARIRAV